MRCLLVLFFFITFHSCGEKKIEFDLSDDQLVGILLDIHLANTAVFLQKNENLDSLKNLYANQITQIHGIDRELLDSIIQNIHLNSEKYALLNEKVDKAIKQLESSK